MEKLLYITDQDEYTDHSFIGPLFEKYLKYHYEINIVYFSEFKAEVEKKMIIDLYFLLQINIKLLRSLITLE